MNIIDTAKSYIGKVKYQYGANNIDGGVGDCSAYTQTVYKKATGIDIGRTALNQSRAGKEVKKEDLQPGDLIIFQNTYKSGASHTGIYLGNNEFVNNGDNGVKVENLNSNYWSSHFQQGRRIVDNDNNGITINNLSTTKSDKQNEDSEDTNFFGSIVVIIVAVLLIILAVFFFINSLGMKKPDISKLSKGAKK